MASRVIIKDQQKHVSLGPLSEILGICARRIQQLTRQGILVRARRGVYDLAESVQGYCAYREWRARQVIRRHPPLGAFTSQLDEELITLSDWLERDLEPHLPGPDLV
jgi:hypothetical protein